MLEPADRTGWPTFALRASVDNLRGACQP